MSGWCMQDSCRAVVDVLSSGSGGAQTILHAETGVGEEGSGRSLASPLLRLSGENEGPRPLARRAEAEMGDGDRNVPHRQRTSEWARSPQPLASGRTARPHLTFSSTLLGLWLSAIRLWRDLDGRSFALPDFVRRQSDCEGGPFTHTAPFTFDAGTSIVNAFNAGILMSDANGGYYTDDRESVPRRAKGVDPTAPPSAASGTLFPTDVTGNSAASSWTRGPMTTAGAS